MAPAAIPASSFRRSCVACRTWSRPPPRIATGRLPISTASFSRRPCATPSGWSSRRWVSRCRAPSSRCCRTAAGAAEHAGADGGADLPGVLSAAADAAAVALDKTTGQLDVLAEAGVVDAGGRGLLVLLDAMSTTLTGRAPAPARVPAVPLRRPTSPRPPPAAPQFEVMYLLTVATPAAWRRCANGWTSWANRWPSQRQRTAQATTQCTCTPTMPAPPSRRPCRSAHRAASRSPRYRAVSARGLPVGGAADRAVLAVVDGDGAVELFAGEGAHVLRPEADAPVSAKQLLARSRQHRRRADHGAAQRLRRRRGTRRGVYRRDRMGHRRRARARRFHGSGAGRARSARRRAAGRRRRLHDGPCCGGRPARLGACGRRGGADVGGYL